MNGSVVRTSSVSTRTWRMRQWPNDQTVAHLIFVDHQMVPTPDVIAEAVEHAGAKGARCIRTSALFPAAAALVLAAGFAPIDRLALLRLELDDDVVAALRPARHRIRPLAVRMQRQAAAVDQQAFGPMWGNDVASLRDIRRATPVHRGRMIRQSRELAAFALSGAAAGNGYLQRIAVAPQYRRAGMAHDLVVDALGWMHGDGRTHCLVNTGVENEAALALYDQLGFTRLPDELTIAERRIRE